MAVVGTINHGLTTATTIIIPNKESPICKQSIIAAGNNSSMAPISLENLFKILPAEFVLKNLMVALVILVNMSSCNLVEDLIQIVKKVNDLINDTTTRKEIMMEYI